MTLVKFNRPSGNQRFPFAGAPFYGDVLNNLFDPNFNPEANSTIIPPVNISETEDHYLIELASAGNKKEDFQLNLEDGKLTVSVEKKSAPEKSAPADNSPAGDSADPREQPRHYTRREFTQAGFSRSFNLPEEADQNEVNAEYENGILSISIGKREDVKLRKVARKIAIK